MAVSSQDGKTIFKVKATAVWLSRIGELAACFSFFLISSRLYHPQSDGTKVLLQSLSLQGRVRMAVKRARVD